MDFNLLEVLFSNTQLVTLFVIIVAIFANALVRLTGRRPMRPLKAFDRLVAMIGASIESNQPVHVSLGSTTIGDNTTMLALPASEFIYYMAREVSIGDASPLFTVAEGSALPLAVDTLRRAFEHEHRVHAYRGLNFLSETPISARWYPSGRRSIAFASALMSMQKDDKLSGNLLLGRYGIELTLVLDAAYRNQVPTVAASDHLDGMAVAYALADDVLIGEEVITASAYPAEDYRAQKRNFVIDLMRGLVVATIIFLVILNLTQGAN